MAVLLALASQTPACSADGTAGASTQTPQAMHVTLCSERSVNSRATFREAAMPSQHRLLLPINMS